MGGGITGASDEYAYCGVINANMYMIYFFLGNLNNLDVDVADVGNDYLCDFTKDTIFTVAESKIGQC